MHSPLAMASGQIFSHLLLGVLHKECGNVVAPTGILRLAFARSLHELVGSSTTRFIVLKNARGSCGYIPTSIQRGHAEMLMR